MQIPTMRSVIDTFGGCAPALEWASDMDVQRGWEVCTEPGWLMLLAFQIQNRPNAVGFQKAALCTYECIKPAMSLTTDPLLHDILNRAFNYSQDLAEFKISGMEKSRAYLVKSIKSKIVEMRQEATDTGQISKQTVIEYAICGAVNAYTTAMIRKNELKVSARLANSAVDSSVSAYVATIHPDFIYEAFNLKTISTKEQIDACELARNIEICQILRSIIPQPFIKYE